MDLAIKLPNSLIILKRLEQAHKKGAYSEGGEKQCQQSAVQKLEQYKGLGSTLMEQAHHGYALHPVIEDPGIELNQLKIYPQGDCAAPSEASEQSRIEDKWLKRQTAISHTPVQIRSFG